MKAIRDWFLGAEHWRIFLLLVVMPLTIEITLVVG